MNNTKLNSGNLGRRLTPQNVAVAASRHKICHCGRTLKFKLTLSHKNFLQNKIPSSLFSHYVPWLLFWTHHHIRCKSLTLHWDSCQHKYKLSPAILVEINGLSTCKLPHLSNTQHGILRLNPDQCNDSQREHLLFATCNIQAWTTNGILLFHIHGGCYVDHMFVRFRESDMRGHFLV